MRRIKLRLQQRIEYEHEKAKYARQHSHEEGPMAAFQRHWVTPGAAVFTKQGPKVALLSTTQDKEPPLRGGVHLRTAAIVEPAKGKRGTSAGWLVSAADVGDDGSEKPRLQAVGKVPTVAAMGGQAPKGAATKHMEQSAHQAAIWAALAGVRGPVPVERQQSDAHNRERHGSAQPPRRAGGRGGATGGRRPGRGGGADAAQRRSGQTDAGQRQ